MKIGIDARLYTQTGVGRYIRNVIEELSILDTENDYIVYLRKDEFDDLHIKNKKWKKKILDIPWHTLKEQIVVPYILTRDQLDVAHFPYFNVPILYQKKFLLTIHDLIVDHFDTGRASRLPLPFYKAKRFGYKIATTLGARRASAITAISETTKQEATDHYSIDPDKITITYDSVDSHFLKVAQLRRPKKLYTFPYILYVGNAYPHKNLQNLISAMREITQKTDAHLVLAGDDVYFFPLLKKQIHENSFGGRIHFFGDANDEQLVDLYSHARILVFPSFMEGFGLPNLEALVCNKLPVVSDIPVFKEIWNDTFIYFDPYNVKDISKKILKTLALSPAEYKLRVEQAKKKMSKFSWRDTAKKTLEKYHMIYEGSK